MSTLHTAKTILQHHFRFDEFALANEFSFVGKAGKRLTAPLQHKKVVLVDELWGLCLDEPKSPKRVKKIRTCSDVLCFIHSNQGGVAYLDDSVVTMGTHRLAGRSAILFTRRSHFRGTNRLVASFNTVPGLYEFDRLKKEGEIFQDLEQDLRAHLVQLEIERYYLDSNTSTTKKSDVLEDVDSTPENTIRICLLHAFKKAGPFRSGGEATATISPTCEELSIIKGIIVRQQKAHSRIVHTIDQTLESKHDGKPNHQRSQGSKDPAKAPRRMHTPLSAWLRNQQILEDVEQLEGEGKRLAEQTIQLVDIKVEDQAKVRRGPHPSSRPHAVTVSTIVTVIFLPLFPVSSYFGINTADIRDTKQNQ
ncbi:MAG: hypothetical protein Q9184_003861 [Pyrenodesmia sp. 2 TL-2023]